MDTGFKSLRNSKSFMAQITYPNTCPKPSESTRRNPRVEVRKQVSSEKKERKQKQYESKRAHASASVVEEAPVEVVSLDKKRQETEAILNCTRGCSDWAPALYERLGKNPSWKRRVVVMVLKSVAMKSVKPLRAQKICTSIEHSEELHQVFLARNLILPLPGGHARFFDHRRDYEVAAEARAHERTRYNFLSMCKRVDDKRTRMASACQLMPNGPCPVRDQALEDVREMKVTLTWPVIFKGIRSASYAYFLPYLEAIREQTFDHGARKVKDMFKKRRALRPVSERRLGKT